MDLSNKVVAKVTKILGSKQLLFKQMCSYYNRNRLFLLHDQSLYNLVKVALKAKGKLPQKVNQELPTKRMRAIEDFRVSGFRVTSNCNEKSVYHLWYLVPCPTSIERRGKLGSNGYLATWVNHFGLSGFNPKVAHASPRTQVMASSIKRANSVHLIDNMLIFIAIRCTPETQNSKMFKLSHSFCR